MPDRADRVREGEDHEGQGEREQHDAQDRHDQEPPPPGLDQVIVHLLILRHRGPTSFRTWALFCVR